MTIIFMFATLAGQNPGKPASTSLERVQGRGCYTYGDNETPRNARSAALALAQEEAVRSYQVYVQSATTVKNFKLEDDVIESASAGMLRNVQTVDEANGRTICVAITAMINRAELDDLIRQRIKAIETARNAATLVLASPSTFGLRVWTDKTEAYIEGDPLTISVQSESDAYLKLDYFQADGTVVHLVPNASHGDAFIRAGRIYTFGGSGDGNRFIVTAPFGAEALKALASTKPFDASLAPAKPSEDGMTYLRGLQGTMRGVKTVASDNSDARWAEASVGVVTVGKAAAEHRATRGLVNPMKRQ